MGKSQSNEALLLKGALLPTVVVGVVGVVGVVRVIGVLGVVEITKATAGVCGVHASSQAVNLASYSLTVMPNTFVNAAT